MGLFKIFLQRNEKYIHKLKKQDKNIITKN